MSKIMRKLGVLVATLTTFLSAMAYDFESGGIYYNITDPEAKEVEVTYKEQGTTTEEYSGEVVVPALVSYNDEQYSVTAIGDIAFLFCFDMTSITIPNTVTAIGENAFENCENLSAMTISGSVTTIGNSAFIWCWNLTSITSQAVTPPECGESVFDGIDTQNCVLYVPAESISAYQQAPQWDRFEYVGEIGTTIVPRFEADGLCYRITDRDAKTVEVASRNDNSSVPEYSGDIVVPSTVTYDGVQYSVTAIGESAFRECWNLTSVTIPNSVTAIGDWAFAGCWNLTSITTQAVTPPECVDNTFGDFNVQNCVLYVPAESVEAYRQAPGWDRFENVGAIGTTIVLRFEADGLCYRITDRETNSVEVTRREDDSSVPEYGGDIVVPSSVTYDGVQYSVTAIGNDAFAWCGNLTSITIPNSVTTIGDWAFAGCENLTSITIPSSVNYIGSGLFPYCSSLTRIDVDADNQTYSSIDGIVYDKSQRILVTCPPGRIGEVIIPNSVTTIWGIAFAYCGNVTSIIIPESVTAIESQAFALCENLTSITSQAVTPPECVDNTFGDFNVENCVLYVPAESIEAYRQAPGWDRFENVGAIGTTIVLRFEADGLCYRITDRETNSVEVTRRGDGSSIPKYSGDIVVPLSVTYGDVRYTVTAISDRAFADCGSLTSIIIPNSVTAIGGGAFIGCGNLTTIKMLAVTPPECNDWTFEDFDVTNCVLYVPEGCVDAYRQAPEWEKFVFIAEIGTSVVTRFEVDGIFYKITDPAAKAVAVIYKERHNSDYSGDLELPSAVTYDGVQYSVTAIGNEAFLDCYSLTSVIIPSTVTSIGGRAFAWCSRLISITLHAVTPPECYEWTFESFDVQSCALYVPEGCVDAYKQAPEWDRFELISEIGTNVVTQFEVDGLCYKVTDRETNAVEVTRRAYDSSIPEYSGDIVVPSTVTYEDVQYTVTAIGEDAFAWCMNLNSITIPGTVTTIGNGAFSGNFLTSFVVDADNPTYSSNDGVLYDKSQTILICWPRNKSVDVVIPNTVTTIADMAFVGCNRLTSITSHAVTPPECREGTLGAVDMQNCVLYVPVESIEAYQQAQEWERFVFVAEIGASVVLQFEVDGIFYKVNDPAANAVEVTYKERNNAAYSGDVVVPSSVTHDGVQYTVTAIGDKAFNGCNGLTSVTIPNSVTRIGDAAFSGCNLLTSIVLPNSLMEIGSSAFGWCSNLTAITIPASVTLIGQHPFIACRSLTSIEVDANNPAYLSHDGILYDKLQTKLISCPAGKTGEVIIPNSVTIIGDGAFFDCGSLISITIPDSVEYFENDAFSGCSGLTSITSLGVTPPECVDWTFYGINKEKCTLYVPAGCKEAYQQASGWESFTKIEEFDPILVTEIQLNETEVTMAEGSMLQLTAKVLPADATDKTLLWESSDASYVTVDATGLLRAIAQGSATITVRSADGNAEATCTVTVSQATGIEAVEAGATEVMEVFTLTGVKIAETLKNLPTGIYLVRQGSTVRKLVVR